MNNLLYTNIQHIPRKEFGLSLNEYVVCDMIYHLSNNPKYNWCIMTKENMAKEIGISKQSVLTLINKMIDKGLIIKDEHTKFLKTSELWYNNFVTDGKESLPTTVKKVYHDGKESLPNNNIYNNNKKNILPKGNIQKKEKYGEFKKVLLSKDQMEKLIQDYGKEKINAFIKKLDEYIENKGAKYKNHALTIRQRIKKDAPAEKGNVEFGMYIR